ncbi:hypothetical protein [Azospirillum palustre]
MTDFAAKYQNIRPVSGSTFPAIPFLRNKIRIYDFISDNYC